MESVYKDIKIKSAVKLYSNADPKMKTVRRFEEHAVKSGNISLLKDALNDLLRSRDWLLIWNTQNPLCARRMVRMFIMQIWETF